MIIIKAFHSKADEEGEKKSIRDFRAETTSLWQRIALKASYVPVFTLNLIKNPLKCFVKCSYDHKLNCDALSLS